MNAPDYYITSATVVRHGVLDLTFADGISGEVWPQPTAAA